MAGASGGGPVDMGKWKGLFEWSMKYQDGTQPREQVTELSQEKREWLDKALKEAMKDFVERMREIKAQLDSGDATSAAAGLHEKEQLLDELADIVENLDHARDLHKIGGLPTLLSLLTDPAPSIRWRGAAVAAACAANNPPVQRWFMEGGVLAPLTAMLADPDATCRAKAALGVSAMVRHYQPGLDAFREAGGLQALAGLLGPQAAGAAGAAAAGAAGEGGAAADRVACKALQLLQYVCQAHPEDAAALAGLQGAVPRIQRLLGDGGGGGATAQSRGPALQLLLEVAAHPEGWAALRQQGQALQQQLQALQQGLEGLGGEDRDAVEEEAAACAQLRQLLAAAGPPAAAKLGQAHHIELEEAAGAGAGAGAGPRRHTQSIQTSAAGAQAQPAGVRQQQQREQQEQREQLQQSGPAGLALIPVPKQEMR